MMGFRGISLFAFVLVLGTAGCGELPPDDEAEPIIGVKIYETEGFFPNVVFSNGLTERTNGEIFLYYGACDETTNLAITTRDELLADIAN